MIDFQCIEHRTGRGDVHECPVCPQQLDRRHCLRGLVCCALLSTNPPSIAFPYVNLDEQGHISYALHLAQSDDFSRL